MKTSSKIIILFFGFIVGAISNWPYPYTQLNLLDLKTWIMVGVGAFIVSLLSTLLFRKSPIVTAFFSSLGVLVAVLFRVIFDLIFVDYSTHNLVFFEIIVTAVQSFVPALIAASIGKTFKRV